MISLPSRLLALLKRLKHLLGRLLESWHLRVRVVSVRLDRHASLNLRALHIDEWLANNWLTVNRRSYLKILHTLRLVFGFGWYLTHTVQILQLEHNISLVCISIEFLLNWHNKLKLLLENWSPIYRLSNLDGWFYLDWGLPNHDRENNFVAFASTQTFVLYESNQSVNHRKSHGRDRTCERVEHRLFICSQFVWAGDTVLLGEIEFDDSINFRIRRTSRSFYFTDVIKVFCLITKIVFDRKFSAKTDFNFFNSYTAFWIIDIKEGYANWR